MIQCRDFLVYLGEIEVVYTEWVPIDSSKVTKLPVEDVTKLVFTHTRQITFLHVRTTMLMFGPKNAPSNQTQYLYLPNNNNYTITKDIDLNIIRPTSGLILTITYFEGIPMCDVFKVCHYSSFELHKSNPDYSIVNIGLVVHFLKNSMFKYQIQSGTKEEVIEQSLKWLTFAKLTTNNYIINNINDIIEQEEEKDIILSDEENLMLDNQENDVIPTQRQSRRSSRRVSKRLSISQNINSTNNDTNNTNTNDIVINNTNNTNDINNTTTTDNNIKPLLKSTNDTITSNNQQITTTSIFNQRRLWLFIGCAFMVLSIYLHRQSSTINMLSIQIDRLYKEISENKELINLTNKKLEIAFKQIEKLILETNK